MRYETFHFRTVEGNLPRSQRKRTRLRILTCPAVGVVVYSLLLSVPAVAYDVTIIDGTRQERDGNPVVPPLFVEYEFLNTITPISDGLLEVTAIGDFDDNEENLLVFAESQSLGSLFINAQYNVLASESLVIPLPLLEQLTSDGSLTLRLEGTSGGGANVNELTVDSLRLAYTSVPEPSSTSTLIVLSTALTFFRAIAHRHQ